MNLRPLCIAFVVTTGLFVGHAPAQPPTPQAETATSTANVPILMYHKLKELPRTTSELGRMWTVLPQNFEEQMQWLARHGFHAITLAQLVGHLKYGQPLPSRPIVISFDDGLREHYAVAFPILKRHNLIGTFFIYTSAIGQPWFATWEELQSMSAAGMEIQSHTVTHPYLRALAPDEAEQEIVESKRVLERRLGKPVIALSYPYGEYDSATVELLMRAGYECAVGYMPGYRQRRDELYMLRRIRVGYGDTLEEFARRLPP